MLLHWLWELKDIVLTLPMNDPFDLDTLNTLTVLSPLWIQLATHFTPSSRTSITSLYNLWGDINLSSEEILSGSFIVFAEDISNVKAFFLEVEHEGISGLKILHILSLIQHILTGRLINLQLQDWLTFHQIPNIQLQHSEVFDRFLQFFQSNYQLMFGLLPFVQCR